MILLILSALVLGLTGYVWWLLIANRQLIRIEENMAAVIDSQTERIIELNDEVFSLGDLLEAKRFRLEATVRDFTELREDYDNLEEEIRDLEEEVGVLEEEIRDLKDDLDSNYLEIRDLEHEIDRLTHELAELQD